MVKPLTFFREVKTELAKVVWPTRKETIRLTLVVVIVSAIVGLFIGGTDFVLTKTMEIVLKK